MIKRQFQNKTRKIAARYGLRLRFRGDHCYLSHNGSTMITLEARRAVLAVIQNRFNDYVINVEFALSVLSDEFYRKPYLHVVDELVPELKEINDAYYKSHNIGVAYPSRGAL